MGSSTRQICWETASERSFKMTLRDSRRRLKIPGLEVTSVVLQSPGGTPRASCALQGEERGVHRGGDTLGCIASSVVSAATCASQRAMAALSPRSAEMSASSTACSALRDIVPA